MQNSEPGQMTFKRILVVVSPEMLEAGHTEKTTLLRRASALAAASGAEIELFHVCHEAGLVHGFFARDESVRAERQRCADRDATRLSELALRMEADGARVSHDVRWDHPRTDAILRKIAESRPDLVMKHMREHTFLLGLTSNTDWDLVRRSPVHIWFVRDGVSRPAVIATAVGATSADEEIVSSSDYAVLGMASLISRQFRAANIPIHAYHAPHMHAYKAYRPDLGMTTMGAGIGTGDAMESVQETWRAVAREHGRQVRTLAEYFHIDPHEVRLEAGSAGDVVPRVARAVGANLIVMGARNLGRWERMTGPVAAEPVLANAPCDVLIVKESDDGNAPAAAERPAHGKPVIDAERAIVDPENTFGSPSEVAEASSLSKGLRRRILAAWEHDVHARMAEDDEGGPVTGAARTADLIARINEARQRLEDSGDNRKARTAGEPPADSQFSKQRRRLLQMTENAKNTRDEYIQKMKAKLDVLNDKMAKLEARAADAKGEMKRELDSELDAIQKTRKEADEKLKGLRQSTDEAWEDLKAGAERAWRSLSESVDSASQRFR